MIQITWTDVSPTQSEGAVDGHVWYRIRRTSTPAANNVWQVTAHFPFPHESHTIWPTNSAAKAAVEESLTTFVGLLTLLGVAFVPEPEA